MRYMLLAVGATVTIILDQITKVWAAGALARGGELPADAAMIPRISETKVIFESWFNFKLAGNKGAAWGLFRNLPEQWRVAFFVVISLVAIVVIVGLYRKADDQHLLRWALTLIMGGAIGNLIDRIRLGYVIDFIDWHTNNTWHWPTFNVADIAISVGVGLLILDMIVQGRKPAEDEAPAS